MERAIELMKHYTRYCGSKQSVGRLLVPDAVFATVVRRENTNSAGQQAERLGLVVGQNIDEGAKAGC